MKLKTKTQKQAISSARWLVHLMPHHDQAVEVMTQPTGNLNFNSKMFSPRQGEELR
jgi:hypothetical protein